jgi:uncharacterized membrane protein HdeD (DUF308 family)
VRKTLSSSWWWLVVRGLAAIAFGILAIAWPAVTLLFLLALFAAYAIVSGGVAIIGSLKNRDDRGWWLVLVFGIISVAAGVVAIFYPGITALALIIVIGVNAVFSGVLDIAMAVRLRKEIRGEWLLGLAGLVSILFGVFVILLPGAGALALIWLISVYAIATGILFIILGIKLRSSPGEPLHGREAPAG